MCWPLNCWWTVQMRRETAPWRSVFVRLESRQSTMGQASIATDQSYQCALNQDAIRAI
jgi:hypothetical protein